MLYSLADIQTFVVLLAGLFLAWGVHVGAQRLVQSRIPETKWLLQHRSGIAGFVDPFAAVAAILSPASAGWTPPVEWNSERGSKRPLVILLLSGPLGNLIVGAACLVGFRAWLGPTVTKGLLQGYRFLLGDFVDFADDLKSGPFLQRALLIVGLLQLIVGVISLIPLPPLEGGRLLFLFTPKTAGWQKAEYQLAERNIGLIIMLAGMIRISNSLKPPFAYLADVIAHALAVLFAGL